MQIFLDLHLYTGLLMMALGILLGIYLARRFHLSPRLWWIGALGFVLSQVGHIPFNNAATQIFSQMGLPTLASGKMLLFNAVFLGLSAGLWEELTRAAIFRWWTKDVRSWRKAVFFGAGWGGAEAIILGGLSLANFIYLTSMRGADLSKIVPPEQLAAAEAQVNAYWSAPWPMLLMPALERAFTIPMHIAFAVMVLQAFTRRQPWWIALAVLWHAVVDAVAVYLGVNFASQPWSPYVLEGVVAVFSAISIAIIFLLRRPEPEEPAPPAAVPQPVPGISPGDLQLDVTEEDLDQSKYQ